MRLHKLIAGREHVERDDAGNHAPEVIDEVVNRLLAEFDAEDEVAERLWLDANGYDN